MNHVAFVVKVATRSFQVTLGILSTTPNGQRAVRAGALSQVTAPQRKTALRAALIAANLPQDTAVLVVDAAPPQGLQVVTAQAPTTAQAAPAPKAEPEAPKAAPAAESRKEWLTPASDPVRWVAEYRAIVKANKGKAGGIARDCHAQYISCGTKWLDWARAHGVFSQNPVAAAAPKAAKPVAAAKPWNVQAKAHADAEQESAKQAALVAGLPAALRAEWVREVYKTSYNFAMEAQGLPHRFLDVGIDAPAMPTATPAQKAA